MSLIAGQWYWLELLGAQWSGVEHFDVGVRVHAAKPPKFDPDPNARQHPSVAYDVQRLAVEVPAGAAAEVQRLVLNDTHDHDIELEIYGQVFIYLYTYMYIYISIHACIHAYTHTYAHPHPPTHTNMHTDTYIDLYKLRLLMPVVRSC